ncbi:MAG TPA: hypothetical protein VN601_10910 [Arthrobacter sp.]|nr:hypothetical protein [Arthrobacter sp.]
MADTAETGVVRRMTLSYAVDLLTTMTAVLICGRLLTPWSDNSGISPILPGELHAAIARFTPFGLWQSYQDTLNGMLRDFAHTVVVGPVPTLLLGLRTIALFLVAAPDALLTVYRQSTGLDAWISVAAAALTFVAFLLMMAGGRLSPARLLLAAMLAPAFASILFWLVQQVLLDAMDILTWFARMAPWCLPCPVLCTLWWVCFPRAPRGAVASLLLFAQQRWAAYAERRIVRPSPAGSRPH